MASKYLTNEQLLAVAEERRKQSKMIFDFVTEHPASPRTYADIKALVQSGAAPEVFDIGDEIPCTYTYNDTEYDYPWLVMDNDYTATILVGGEEVQVPGMIIAPKYCTIESVPLDPAWTEEATEETALEGLYYCGRNANTYKMLNLIEGDAVPYGEYEHIYHGAVNNASVYQYGYNNYIYSCFRAWLNSDKPAGRWLDGFERLPGQVNPSALTQYAGYMAGLPEDFINMVGPVKQSFAANTVTDKGVVLDFYDTFWCMSIEQMYGAPQLKDVEGPYMSYWKDITGLETPSNNANSGRIIRPVNTPQGSAQSVRLRSSNRSTVHSGYYVATSGQLNNGSAYTAYRALPACVIR